MFVDDGGETADFVSLVRDRQPFVQAFGRDPVCVRGQMIDGSERATRQQVSADTGQSDDQRQAKHEDDQDFGKLFTNALLRARHSQHDVMTADSDRSRDRAPPLAVRDDRFVAV